MSANEWSVAADESEPASEENPCCGPAEQASCCEPSAKEGCCEPATGGGCGCR